MLNYNAKAEAPGVTVRTVLQFWRSLGYRVEVDRSTDAKRPEAIVGGSLIELSVHGYPDRGEVWISGNTVCLPGEVPNSWRDVL